MAIRFHCQRCRQLLAIGSRKAGREIRCPKCGEVQLVPTQENPNGEPPSEPRSAAAIESLVVSTWLQEADNPPAPPILVSPLRLGGADEEAPEAPPAQWPITLEPVELPASVQPAVASASQESAVPPGMVLVRRRAMHLQSFLFLVLAAATFALGYYAGSQSPSRPLALGPAVAGAALEPTMVEGQVIFESPEGRLLGDVGALVIALPEGKLPKAPLMLGGLRPGAPSAMTAEQQKSLEQIRELGGAQARVENKGQFSLLLRPGKYRILFISAHARRATGSEIDEGDSGEMRRYFGAPETLIGPYKYGWGLRAIGPGTPAPNEDFRRDEAK